MLTMAFLGVDNRQDLPRISYSTALDLFVGVCFFFVLASIIQFASVHYSTTFGNGEVTLVSDDSDSSDDETTLDTCLVRRTGLITTHVYAMTETVDCM